MKNIQNKLNSKSPRPARLLFLYAFLGICTALVSAGYKEETKVAAEPDPVGTYALVTVDGKQVPCAVEHDGHALTIKSGIFIINADGSCSSKMVFTPPSGGDATREVKATYTRQGATLTMKWEGAGTTTGNVEGNAFTMNNEGMLLSYRK